MDGIAAGATSVKTEIYCDTMGIGSSDRRRRTRPGRRAGAAVAATATPTGDADVAISARNSVLASTANSTAALYSVSVSGRPEGGRGGLRDPAGEGHLDSNGPVHPNHGCAASM